MGAMDFEGIKNGRYQMQGQRRSALRQSCPLEVTPHRANGTPTMNAMIALVLHVTQGLVLPRQQLPMRSAALTPRRPIQAGLLNSALSFDSRCFLALNTLDTVIGKPALRAAQHAPAIASLACLGALATGVSLPSGVVGLRPLAATAGAIVQGSLQGPLVAKGVGAAYATLATPARLIWLAWPLISLAQLCALTFSLLRPARMYRPPKYLEPLQAVAGAPMSPTDLAALTLANGCAIAWLGLAQGAASGRLPLPLPLGCTLLLPLLAFFAGQPLRKGENAVAVFRPLFELLSSCGLLAGLLGVATELQHGGRVPAVAALLATPEGAACAAVGLAAAAVSLPGRCLARRALAALALGGIVGRRLAPLVSLGGGLPAAATAAAAALRSPSLVAAVVLWAWALQRLWAGGAGRGWTPPKPKRAPAQKQDGRPGFGERGVFF